MKAIQTLPGTFFPPSTCSLPATQPSSISKEERGPHATLCISLRHRATPESVSVGRLSVHFLCSFFRDRLSCGSARRRRMNSLFGWLHKYYDLWSSGMFEHKRSVRSERAGDSLWWRCSLIIIFVAFVLQYKYFSALTMILNYEWKFIQVATLRVVPLNDRPVRETQTE